MAHFWESEERGSWKAMDKAVSDLIDANYVRHLDGPASGGCFTALVILRATTKDMTLISERWRFDLAEMKQYREHCSMGDGDYAGAWSVVAVKNIRRVTVENIRALGWS